jgi:hypothetical protein
METTGAVLPPITIEASERIFTEFNDITKEGGQVLEGLSAREIDARLDTLHSSPTGVSKIAQQMLSPLKRDLLYEGRMRQIFQTYKLALGEEARFDADIAIPAAGLSVNGLPVQLDVKSDRVNVDTSPIATKPFVRWNESNFRKYDILNRAQERAKASIQFQEDVRGFSLLQFASTLGTGNDLPTPLHSGQVFDQGVTVGLEGTTAGTNNPSVIKETAGRLTMDKFTEAIVTLRAKLESATRALMNPFREKDFILFNQVVAGTGGAGIFAPNYQEQMLKSGRPGSAFGIELISSIVVPVDQVYVLAPSDYIGVLAIRTDISVETLKDVNQFADVFAIWEDLGFVIRFAKGICRIDLS